MVVSQAYSDMLVLSQNRFNTEGQRPYPSHCMEIYLLAHAEQQAREQEIKLFDQLTDIFDWQLTRKQRNGFREALRLNLALILTDLAKTVIWTSHGSLSITGFTHAESVGCVPSFLQGDETERPALRLIKDQLNKAQPVKAELTSYRKNGEAYQSSLVINPIKNQQGELTHYIAVESEV